MWGCKEAWGAELGGLKKGRRIAPAALIVDSLMTQ